MTWRNHMMDITYETSKMIANKIDMAVKEYMHNKDITDIDFSRFELIRKDLHDNKGYQVYIYDKKENYTTKIIEIRYGDLVEGRTF